MSLRSGTRSAEDAAVSIKKVDQLGATLGALFQWGGSVWIAYYGFKSIDVLAGKTTFTSIWIRFWAEKPVLCGLSVTIGIAGIVYGKLQAAFRHQKIRADSKRIQELESRLDPKRTSSNLTVRGTTRKEDRE